MRSQQKIQTFKDFKDDDDHDATTISYKQIYDLSVKVLKENGELEKNILIYKNHVKS